MDRTKSKKGIRAADALNQLTADGQAVFFTLTTADEVDLPEIRRRWRAFRNWFARDMGSDFKYIMNFELHPGYLQKVVKDKHGERVLRSDGRSHGWHIHGVCNRFVYLKKYLVDLRRFGFGRVDFRRVTSEGVSEYLTKHALKAYRGLSRRERAVYGKCRIRLVNTSRGLPRLSDYVWRSDLAIATADIAKPEIKCRQDGLTSFASVSHDFRAVYLKSQILAMMGYLRYADWLAFLEAVQVGYKVGGDLSAFVHGSVARRVWASVLPPEMPRLSSRRKKATLR